MPDQKRPGKQRASRRNPYQRAIDRYDNIYDTFASEVSNFLGFINDADNPCTGFSFSRRDEGGFLIVMKRMEDMTAQVMFARSDDVISTVIEANRKLSAGAWREAKPWTPTKGNKSGS